MAKEFPKYVGNSGSYPDDMRRQLWPLCCGASIISGFKDVHKFDDVEELTKAIESTINDYLPDLQVFNGEKMMPKLTFLTLNSAQMGSKKIMDAITAAGFVKFATANPRGSAQGFFVHDTSGSFKSVA